MKPKTKEQIAVDSLIGKAGSTKKLKSIIENGVCGKENSKRGYVMVAECNGKYQIFRYFYYVRNKKTMQCTNLVENFRIYYNTENHKRTLAGRMFNGLASIHTQYPVFGGYDFEIRNEHAKQCYGWYYNSDYTEIFVDDVYAKKIHPELKKCGINKKLLRGQSPGMIMYLLFNTPKNMRTMCETIIKTAPANVLSEIAYRHGITEDQFTAYKICKRNKYDLSAIYARDYFDYINQLVKLNKDIRNSKYVCPCDFDKAHQSATRKIAEMDRRERERRQKIQAKKDYDKFFKEKGVYLGICIITDDITIKPLMSPAEYIKEGEEMHHCVGTYYTKPESIVLSATINGERVETVEVDLKTCKVLQSRGVNNGSTKYHESIVNAVNSQFRKEKNKCLKKAS